MSVLNQAHFQDEAAAFEFVESVVWPEGPVCPDCGNKDKIYVLKGVRSKPSKKHPEGVERHGLKKCGKCLKQFTVRVGTVFESSHLPSHQWLQAFHLMCSSKKGISANQLSRVLEVKLQTAWFVGHRIREAMRAGNLATTMGGAGKYVEADETFIGKKEGAEVKRGYSHKMAALSLVERGGEVRSFQIDKADTETIKPIVDANLRKESMLMTDEAKYYGPIGKEFKWHFTVCHSEEEYVRGAVHTNTLEGYFSIFKRGMKGVYQHCAEKHLHRYLAEFDFRYNNRIAKGIDDKARAMKALEGVKGKRLTYRRTNEEINARP
ncbi:MAG: IS1595 family transposase [Rhodomicrobium sp.]|nr:IS1595 family transposase [Rhodomicrobium sp.]